MTQAQSEVEWSNCLSSDVRRLILAPAVRRGSYGGGDAQEPGAEPQKSPNFGMKGLSEAVRRKETGS